MDDDRYRGRRRHSGGRLESLSGFSLRSMLAVTFVAVLAVGGVFALMNASASWMFGAGGPEFPAYSTGEPDELAALAESPVEPEVLPSVTVTVSPSVLGPSAMSAISVGPVSPSASATATAIAPPTSSPPPPPPQVTRYEAETATLSECLISTEHAGFSGSGFANYLYVSGSYVQWDVTASQAGTATLRIRFTNGTEWDRTMDLQVNGALVVDDASFPGDGDWLNWRTRTFTVTLTAGANTVRATASTGNGGPDVDYLEVVQ